MPNNWTYEAGQRELPFAPLFWNETRFVRAVSAKWDKGTVPLSHLSLNLTRGQVPCQVRFTKGM